MTAFSTCRERKGTEKVSDMQSFGVKSRYAHMDKQVGGTTPKDR